MLTLLKQVEIAFSYRPSKDGTLHGDRRIKQGCRGKRTALFPSRKCGGSIAVESRLELSHAVLLEQDARICDFRSQALYINLPGNKRICPDFLVKTSEGAYEFHEVKPGIAHVSAADLIRFELLTKILRTIEIGFSLVERSDLPDEIQLQKLLHTYTLGHQTDWTDQQKDLAKNALAAHNYKQISEMHEVLYRIDLPVRLAEYFIFHREILLDP